MPLRMGHGKRSRPNIEQGGTTLKGWDFMQERILSHDEDMIADFADDIDTLLVFAGLFSAVLTAFLVLSLVLLQPDNSQLSVQLLSLLVLQNGAPPRMQPFLNATADGLPGSDAVQIPTDIVAVNTLWFISLVFSLAAALFGILAKQWCREYLRWHNSILPARDNVLLRQLRYEAWEAWKVPSFISAIPALLELALILFLVGLLVFVPSFSERSLSAVVSVVIGSVLIGSVVLTVLPLFYSPCPFQSPTGWAFLQLVRAAHKIYWQVVLASSLSFNRLLPALNIRKSRWRWDVPHYRVHNLSVAEKQANWRDYNLQAARDFQLCESAIPGARHMRHSHWKWPIDTVQTRILVRALSWIRRSSNDNAIRVATAECLPSLHIPSRSGEIKLPYFISSIHAICAYDVVELHSMIRAVFLDVSETCTLSFLSGPKSILELDQYCGPFITNLPVESRYRTHYNAWERGATSFNICHALLRHDLSSLADDWLAFSAVNTKRQVADDMAVLFCALRVLPMALVLGPDLVTAFKETLEEVYRKLVPHRDACATGLVSMCLELCCCLGSVAFVAEGNGHHIVVDRTSLCDIEGPWDEHPRVTHCNLVSSWATLAVDIWRHNENFTNNNGRHLFVVSVSRVFETMRLRLNYGYAAIDRDDKITPVSELLSHMADALKWSLVHSEANCGAYMPLPWIKDLLHCYTAAPKSKFDLGYRLGYDPAESIPLIGNSALRPTFFLILSLIEACLHRKLITGEMSAGDLDDLLMLLRSPALPRLSADFTPADPPEAELEDSTSSLEWNFDISEYAGEDAGSVSGEHVPPIPIPPSLAALFRLEPHTILPSSTSSAALSNSTVWRPAGSEARLADSPVDHPVPLRSSALSVIDTAGSPALVDPSSFPEIDTRATRFISEGVTHSTAADSASLFVRSSSRGNGWLADALQSAVTSSSRDASTAVVHTTPSFSFRTAHPLSPQDSVRADSGAGDTPHVDATARAVATFVDVGTNVNRERGIVTMTGDDEEERDLEAGPPIPSPTDSDGIEIV